jgi:hypothetical protein
MKRYVRTIPVLLLAVLLGCRSPARPLDETVPVTAVNEHVAPEIPAPGGMTVRERTPEAPIPSGLTTMAGRIALDKTHVYWVDAHTAGGSRLLSAPKAGGAPVELATAPTEISRSIAVDDAFVFFGYVGRDVPDPHPCLPDMLCRSREPTMIHGPTGAVLAVSKRGGRARTLVSDANVPGYIAADGKHVYWADDGTYRGELSRVAREGGQRALLLKPAQCYALALDATYVYCGYARILRVPKAGGAREELMDHGSEALALGPNAVYFDSSIEVRRSVPRTAPPCHPWQQAVCFKRDPMIDDVPIFAAVPKAGGSPSEIARENVGPHLVVDGRRAYWMNNDRVMAVDLAGGAPVQVAEAIGALPSAGLAVDESRLYWITRQGELRSAPK